MSVNDFMFKSSAVEDLFKCFGSEVSVYISFSLKLMSRIIQAVNATAKCTTFVTLYITFLPNADKMQVMKM